MTSSSYDAIASWYEQWVANSPSAVLHFGRGLLPTQLAGERVLDVACGHGRLSRELAAVGADVVGVDISAELISKARSIEAATPRGIDYHVADVGELDAWWDTKLFDGAASEMALMDIADLPSTVNAVATVVRPKGWFVASLVHPCFPGNDVGLSSWPPEKGYTTEGFWTSDDHNPEGVRIRLGSYHRTLSTYLNTLIDAGLQVERIMEPSDVLPQTLLVFCRRKETQRHGTS